MSALILIIDDAEHLRAIMKMTLEFKGYTVHEAGDGREGLDAARAYSFDLIFCDIEMPVMNGIEFVRRFRAEVSLATPIVMLTAEGSGPIGHALSAGATAAVSKPFEPIRLLKEIERHLNQTAD